MPAVIEFNRSAPTSASENIAQAMGLNSGDEIESAVKAMTKAIGLPTSLSEIGVTRDLFERIVTGALADHSHKTNPRDATSADYITMLEASF